MKSFSHFGSMSKLCAHLGEISCSYRQTLHNVQRPALRYEFVSLNQGEWRQVIAVNCARNNKYRVHVSFVAQNGKHEYLSMSEIPYKALYAWLAGLWGVASAVWVAHWWRYLLSAYCVYTFCPLCSCIGVCVCQAL